jgi:hypothetical protein
MRKKPNQRRQSRPAPLSYGRLEPRQMLAATGLPQFDGDTSLRAFIVENGTFNANDVEAGQDNMLDPGDVAGWDVVDARAKINLLKSNDNPRATILELDSTAEQFDRVTQTLATESGVDYTLAFDLRGRNSGTSADPKTNSVQVFWDGEHQGTFRGIDFWQTVVLHVTADHGDSTVLEFREVEGAGNDGLGPLIDNVRLVKISSMSIDNEGFEFTPGTGTLIDAHEVSAWNAYGNIGDQMIDLRIGDASEGSQFVNLDSSDTRVDRLYRHIQTEVGGTYFLSFDLRASDGTSDQSQELRVRWNDAWAGTFRGDKDWQSFGMVLTADSDLTRLVLREPPFGDHLAGDGSGPFLDNVRLVKVENGFGVNFGSETEFAFDEGASVQAVALGLELMAPATLQSAKVELGPTADRNFETLAVDVAGTSITQSFHFATGILQLAGPGSVAEYQHVLRTLIYENTSQNPVPAKRPLTLTIAGSQSSSIPVSINIAMNPVNDGPTIGPIPNQAANVASELVVAVDAADVEIDTLAYTISFDSSKIQIGDNLPSINNLGVINWMPSRAVTLDITVNVNDGHLSTDRTFQVVVAEPIETGTVTVFGSALPPYDSTPDPAIGQTAPSFEAQSFDGSTHQFTADGTARLYTFMAHW